MTRNRQPLPPGDVRLLAACSHLGVYFGVLLELWMEIGSESFRAHDPLDESILSTGAFWVTATVALLGPPAAALWAARSSPWRGFLRSHGSRALVFQSAGMLGYLVAAAGVAVISPPEIIALVLSLVAAALVLAWLVLPVGAAFRAKDGDLAWYPFVARIFPDPPEQGWRTPLPPGPP
jgi:uncharacterized Tic20 family protein